MGEIVGTAAKFSNHFKLGRDAEAGRNEIVEFCDNKRRYDDWLGVRQHCGGACRVHRLVSVI